MSVPSEVLGQLSRFAALDELRAFAAMRAVVAARDPDKPRVGTYDMSETGQPTELEGPSGRFRIAQAGMFPEKGHLFLYEDDRHRFFFSAQVIAPSPPEFKIEINYANTERLGGGLPRVAQTEVSQIEANVKYFFQTRQFLSIHKPIVSPLDRAEDIKFSWRFR